jgi:hypothetical protein
MNGSDATPISMRRAPWRLLQAAEAVLVTASVLVLIWVLQPRVSFAPDVAVRLVIVSAMLVSNIAHRDGLKRLGLRLDNFAAAARIAALPTAVAAAIVITAGAILASPEPNLQRAAVNFAYYVGWAFAQQYALQGFILLRVVDAGLGRLAPVTAAALFALVHLPNPGLTMLTLAGAWMWATLFRREPNLLVLALSHALLAVIAEAMLPSDVTGGYRLGPRYLEWAAGRS